MKNTLFLIVFISNIAVLSAQDTFQLAPPILKYPSLFFTKEAKIEMAFAEPNTEIHFTTNGEDPTLNDAIYKGPLPTLSGSAISITTNFTTVKARVFSKIYQTSDVVAATFIKDGLPIKSVDCTPPNPKYAGLGATSLIDNKGGTTVLSSKTWLGFQTDTVEIVLNLNKKLAVKKVLLNLLQDYGSWIFLPEKIDVFTFDNKTKTFQLVGNQIFNQEKEVKGSICTPSVLTLKKGVKTDKIKVQLFLVKSIPDWHAGKGSRSEERRVGKECA